MNAATETFEEESVTTPTRLIELEQVRMLFHQMSTSVSGTLFGATLLILMMWSALSHEMLLFWLGCVALNQGWRLYLYKRFLRLGISLDSVGHWTRLWTVGAGISAALWSVANLLFFVSNSPLHQALLFTTVFAIVSVAVPLIAAHFASLVIFVMPVMLSSIIRNGWEGDRLHALFACIAAAAMFGMIAVGRKYNQLLTASQRARFENETLAVRLARQNSELEHARNAAEQASLAKSKFLAAASHDLRQPLHALTLFADALRNETDPVQVGKLTQHIGTSVTALETLFSSLLDISKLDAGVVRCQETDFPAQDVFDRIDNDFAPLAGLKRLRFKVRPTSAQLRTDAVLFEQLLRNLVANAVRYTERGSIMVACRRRGKRWRIEVRDSGIGIPADKHQKVFEEFFQLDNPERDRHKGLGLGLAIVSRLSRLLACPLELISEPGRGTTMAISVPMGRANAPAAAAARPDSEGFHGLRVLIIDDETEVRVAMHTILNKWGCDTMAAESLVDAMSAMSERHWEPELAISDYRLKDNSDGIQVLNWLREQYGHGLPCMLITGDIEADRLKAVRESGYLLLHKPIPPAKLRAVVGSLMSAPEEAA